MLPLSIDPIAFSLGPIDVHWYGIILALGALLGTVAAIQEGKRFGLTPDFFLDLLLFGAPSAIVAARIYYVAFKWDYYRENPDEIIQIWNGGIAIYGAIIGALICGWFYIRAKGYRFSRIVDICAPSLLIGQMIGRWGNFVNQEAYGGTVEESFLRDTLHLPSFIVDQMNVSGVFRHPTFLYESLWSLLGLVIIFIIRRMNFLKAGELFLFYIIWYSIGRFNIEALRTDSLAYQGPDWLASLVNGLWAPMDAVFDQGYLDPEYGNIRISQLLALLIVLFGILFIVYRRVSGKASERYNDPLVNYKTGVAATTTEAAPAEALTAKDADLGDPEETEWTEDAKDAERIELPDDGARVPTEPERAAAPEDPNVPADAPEAEDPEDVENPADPTPPTDSKNGDKREND